MSRAVVNLRRLSREVLHAILAGIEQKHVSPSLSVASYLFNLAPTNIHRIVSTPAVEEEVPAAVAPPQSKKSSEAILATLVRTSLMCAIENASFRQFRSRLRSLAFEGVDVGDKYHSGTFYQHSTFLAARYIDLISAHRARMPLAGLGVPSSFHLVFDSVPLGGCSAFGRNESPEILRHGGVDPVSGRLTSTLITWTVSNRGHSGEVLRDVILQALLSSPWALGLAALRSGLSSVGGDGAVVQASPLTKNEIQGGTS